MSGFRTLALMMIAALLLGISAEAWCYPPGGTVTIYVDDAKTRQITVPKLDPDEIAEKSKFGLSFGFSIGDIGISLGWERKKGIEYDEKCEELIEQLGHSHVGILDLRDVEVMVDLVVECVKVLDEETVSSFTRP